MTGFQNSRTLADALDWQQPYTKRALPHLCLTVERARWCAMQVSVHVMNQAFNNDPTLEHLARQSFNQDSLLVLTHKTTPLYALAIDLVPDETTQQPTLEILEYSALPFTPSQDSYRSLLTLPRRNIRRGGR